jgi:hypothetical protein
MDALNYYEKIGDYQSIVFVFFELPIIIPYDIAKNVKAIFERAPVETFDNVMYFATIHMNVIASLGNIEECFNLAEHYKNKFLTRSKDDMMRSITLSGIYFCLGLIRAISKKCLTT